VSNCYIHDAPCEYRGGCALFAGYVSEFLAEHNAIAHVPYTGISIGWGWGRDSYMHNNECAYNGVYDVAQALADCGHFYTLGSMKGSSIHRNWFDGFPKRPNGGAMYPDQGSGYIEIHHNVCSRIEAWYFFSNSLGPQINVNDNWSDNASARNIGGNLGNLTVVKDGRWPAAAQAVMEGAGLESAWADVKTLPCACSVLDGEVPLSLPAR
jgi:hypothetical protein